MDICRQQDQVKSRFFVNISHEFRTPLTLIMGPIEDAIQRRAAKIELSRDELGMIHRNAGRLLRLINQLLDISKLESGEMKLSASKGDLEKTVEIITLSYISLAERKNIKYTWTLPGAHTRVYYDYDKLEKILTNLLSNAFKFTGTGGEVNLSLWFDSSGVSGTGQIAVLEVTDTGKELYSLSGSLSPGNSLMRKK